MPEIQKKLRKNGAVFATDVDTADANELSYFKQFSFRFRKGAAHGEGAGQAMFSDIVLVNDELAILVPFGSSVVGRYNPSTDTYTEGDTHGQGGIAFWGGEIDSDGRVIFSPWNANNVGIYDPDTDTYTDGPQPNLGGQSFRGACPSGDGRVILGPWLEGGIAGRDNPDVGIFDPADDSLTLVNFDEDAQPFSGVILADTGDVICIPNNSLNFYIFDPSTETISSGAQDQSGESSDVYNRAIKKDDGIIVCVPSNEDFVCHYNPFDDTARLTANTNTSNIAFEGGGIHPNGNFLFATDFETIAGQYDPDTESYVDGPSTTNLTNSRSYKNAVLYDDDLLLMAPNNEDSIGIIF